MAEHSNIEWTDATWNGWIGCTRVSPACDDCYAARSTPARSLGVAWGSGEPRRRTSEANWKLPLRWESQHAEFFETHGRRRRVFCASLADWLDNEVPIEWLADLLDVIRLTPNLDWLLLTKRIGNWRSRLEAVAQITVGRRMDLNLLLSGWLFAGQPPANVWLGATVVNQAEYNRDIGKLRRIPAAVHFLSIEPMLGHIDMRMGGASVPEYSEHRPLLPLDWVIVGGESGPKARPMHPDWVRSLRDQCAAAGVPFLFKQWGEWIEPDIYGNNARLTVREGDPEFESAAAAMDGFLCTDGRFAASLDDMAADTRYLGMLRIGKKAAGRHLDGVTHDGFPGGQGA